MATYFRDPDTGVVQQVTGGLTWLWQLLFSPLHLAYHSLWGQAVISLVAAIFTVGLSFIVYAFLGYSIIKNGYRKRGWKEVPENLLEAAKKKEREATTLRQDELD